VSALSALIDIYSAVVFVSVLGSWVRSDNAVFRFADQLTEPVLAPIRKVVPPAGGFDLSPMLLLVVLRVLGSLLR
jgi:YggT family protein